MKKKGLAIEGVIFFSILVINIYQSFGQISVRSSNDLINGVNSNPYIFSSLNIKATLRVVVRLVSEVERQLKGKTSSLAAEFKPDYKKCVDVTTRGSLIQMTLPLIIPFLVVVLIWFLG